MLVVLDQQGPVHSETDHPATFGISLTVPFYRPELIDASAVWLCILLPFAAIQI
jgi:hypothetical protein